MGMWIPTFVQVNPYSNRSGVLWGSKFPWAICIPIRNLERWPKPNALYVFLDMGGKDVILPKMETKSACYEIQEALYNQIVFFLIFMNITN